MYDINSTRKSVLTRLFFVTFLTFLAFSSVAYAEDCTNVNRLDVNTNTERFGLTGSETEIFEVYADGPGILTFSAVAPMTASADLKLALFDNACQPVASVDGAEVLARFTSEVALWVETPGVYRFGVAAQDPSVYVKTFHNVVRFVNEVEICDTLTLTQKAVAESEDVPDLAKAVAESEDVPDLFRTCLARAVAESEDVPDLHKAVAESEDVPDLVQMGLSSLPMLRANDDHADSFFFATPVSIGHEMSAMIDDRTNKEFDVFTFQIKEHTTVNINISEAADIQAKVYDRHGHSLAVLAGENSSAARTLAPGRYFVRIDGPSGVEASYKLSVATLGW